MILKILEEGESTAKLTSYLRINVYRESITLINHS